jgi:hypothetical protein
VLINYKDFKPQGNAQFLIDNANRIIADYERQGYKLTLRQLYYQFVQENLFANNQTNYDKLGNAISRGRMAGMVSWNAIEDKHRSTSLPEETMDDVQGAIDRAQWFIDVNHWDNQEYYVEVWVEKDALGNVIERACEKYDIAHMACKGYLSTSMAWEAGQRIEEKIDEGKQCVIIHLGDHDASGIDMSRDNQDRLTLFSRSDDVVLRRIALNMDQVNKYSPPPNPAKMKDPRAAEYIANYGNISWELDALKPQVIVDLIRKEAEKYIDMDVWQEAQDRREELREKVRELARSIEV